MPKGLEDVSKYPDLFDRLYENREGEPTWTREDLEKLAGRNFIRVFQAVEAVNTKITNNALITSNKRIIFIIFFLCSINIFS